MLNIESLEERRIRCDFIMCYKILRGFVNLDRSMFFVLAESSQTRGNSMKLYTVVTVIFMLTFLEPYREYLDLPDSVVTAPSVATFRERLRNCDLSKYVLY